MAETKVEQHTSLAGRLKAWIVPVLILVMAVGIVFLIAGNWNTWVSGKAEQETDDAYTRADLTPLSTKVAGLVATVPMQRLGLPEEMAAGIVFIASAAPRSTSTRPRRSRRRFARPNLGWS